MGWIKKVGRVFFPAPVIIHDVVVEDKSPVDAVKDAATAPVSVLIDAAAAIVVDAVAEVDNKLTQMEATLIGKVGGDKARNLFLDVRRAYHAIQPLGDIQMQKQLIDSTQQFVDTLDPAFLNPLVAFIAKELEQARDNFWDKAAPIPESVIKAMPAELAGLANTSRHILVTDANLLSLPAFAVKHLEKAKAVAAINLIFFKRIPGSDTDNDLSYWAHEITHLLQYKNMGLIQFAEKYFHEEWRAIGNDGYINAIEVEADQYVCKHFPFGEPQYIGRCP